LQGKKYQWGDEWPPPIGSGNFADVAAKGKYATWRTFKDYDDGYSDTSPVGAFRPNGYGLYDMAGNVWQFVHRGKRCRGGSFASDNQDHFMLVYCSYSNPDASFGFRVARTPK
jgi:formylglycine-generating enzyme required for sulfatase activity